VRVLCNEESAHVAQHHEDVLVHGVDMKQIMLHLPHDAAEWPQGTPQHRGLVHQSHRMGDALGLLQDAQEVQPVDGVAPEGAIHQCTRVVERA
jgi:hypothetical protein